MSDIYSITRGQLEDVADAIRSKTGKNNLMTVAEMPNEIESIESGGGGGLIYSSNCIAMSNGIVLPSTIGIARIPTPDDCPFNCNAQFLGTNDARYTVASSSDGTREYWRTKYSDSKYVIVIAVHWGNYNNILYISPDKSDAVEFQTQYGTITSTDSYVYNGTTWYFSSTGFAIAGDMVTQDTTASIYPETVTLNNNKYSDASKEAILQYVGASLKPTPSDCPFTCNLTYFMDSPKEWTINGGSSAGGCTYTKTYSNYCVGICVKINPSAEAWTAPILLAPQSLAQHAIEYVYQSSSDTITAGIDKTFDYKYDDNDNSVKWCSSQGLGTWGHHIANGIPMYSYDTIITDGANGVYTEAHLIEFLKLMQVKNKPAQGGGN